MTTFERLTLLVMVLAIIVSVVTLVRQSRQAKRMTFLENAQLRQQQATAALHEKQLEQLLATDKRDNSAHVKLELFKHAQSYRFRVTNLGPGEARNVSVRFPTEAGGHDPSSGGDYASKFPAPTLAPDASIDFLASIYLDSPSAYNAVVSWTDLDGFRVDDSAYVTL